jgi:SAM-dependent methyltransferase
VADQVEVNDRFWSAGGQVGEYVSRTLMPAEALMLVRQREALSGRVLEIGCGAGRVLSYLVEFGGEVHGIDISADMIEYCRDRFPQAHLQVADLQDLSQVLDGGFSAVVAADNVIDVLDDDRRRQVLRDIHAMLVPDGVLAFSSHNLAHVRGTSATGTGPTRALALARKAAERPPSDVVRVVKALPQRRANRRRLAGLERREAGYAVLNDEAHDFNLLHYYVTRDEQERQLTAAGFELLECREESGRPVPPGSKGAGPWLFYVGRRLAR